MWGKRINQKAMLKSANVLLALALMFLLISVFAEIGIDNSDPQYKRIFNNDANYWLDITGFQISNTPSEHQANMRLCFEAKCGLATIPKTCADSLAWNWFDDNTSEYARTTSYTTIGNVDLNILYALDSPDQNNILIQPLIRNRTGFTCDANLYYEQRDLNLNNDNNSDWVQFWKNGEQNYDLQGLNLSAADLDVNRVRIFDVVQLNDMILWWDSVKTINDINSILDYNLQIYQQAGQQFSPVSLKVMLGTIATNTTAKFNLWWKDAITVTGCTLNLPSSDPNIAEGSTFTYQSTPTTTGTGAKPDVTSTAQVCNNSSCSADVNTIPTDTAVTSMDWVSASSPDTNPVTLASNLSQDGVVKGRSAGTYYVRCKVTTVSNGCTTGCYSTTQVVTVTAPPQNNAVDANTVKIDGNPYNKTLPAFIYGTDGNLTIDFNVSDKDWNGIFYGKGRLDANIDYQDWNTLQSYRIITDLNLTRSKTNGSNAGLYCDDLNFAGGTDKNRYGVTCHWDWNIMNITDRNVFIDINVTDNNGSTDVNVGDFNFHINTYTPPPPNKPVDVNIVRPNGGEIIGVRDGNYRIDFNVSDKDCNGVFYCSGRLDANIDYNISNKWTRVVTDLNLLATATAGSNKGIYCDDLNFAGSKDANKEVTCHYDWNLAVWREPSVDSKIDVNVTDNNGSEDTTRSGANFRLHNWLVSSSTAATAYNNSRKLVRNADGNRIYLVYEANPPTSSNKEIWFVQSDNNGSTWTTPVNVSNDAGGSSKSAIDINSTNGINVVWEDGTVPTHPNISYNSCSGDCNNSNNWGAGISIGSGNDDYAPAIDINSSDGISVVWYSPVPVNHDILYKSCSKNCGVLGNWSFNINISNTSSYSRNPSLDINSTGGVHVVWYDATYGTEEILYNSCSGDCGIAGNWNSDVNLSNNSGASTLPSLVISNDNKVHVVWHDNTSVPDSSVRYKNCSSNCGAAGSWGNDFNVNDANGTYPTIAADSDNNVYVVWMDDNAGITANRDNINTRKRNSNGTWDANIIKTTDGNNNDYPNTAKTLLAGAPYDYLQYVYTRGLAADFNIVFGNDQKVPTPPNRPVDANTVKIDGNPDNLALPSFTYGTDGNLTIDFNVFDLDYNGIFWGRGRFDANIDARDANGTSFRIITDLNLMLAGRCDDLNFAGSDKNIGSTCHWDWNIMRITDRNVFIDLNVTDNNGSTDINSSDYNFQVLTFTPPPSNNEIDVNIVRPNGGEIIGVRDGNYRIDFNVSDKDWNGIFYGKGRLDANIDYNVGGGWKRIVTDLNLLATATAGSNKGIYCDDLNFAGSKDANKQVTCHYDWNLAVWREPSVDSRIDVNVTDNNGSTDTNRSASTFRLHNWLISSSATATAYNNSRKLVRNADGNRIYLVYEARPPTTTSREIWFTQSDNNGSTWNTPVNVSNDSGISLTPAIDINSTGGLYVMWSDNTYGSQYDILSKSCSVDCNVASNWSADTNISNNSGLSEDFSFDINSTDGLNIVWEDDTSGNFDILFRSCSFDCGNAANWSYDVNLSNNAPASVNPTIDINSTDGISVAWAEGPVRDISYSSCSRNCNDVSNWSAPFSVVANSGQSDNVVLTISNDDKIHLVWNDNTSLPATAPSVRYRNCSGNCGAAASWGNDFNVNDANGTYPSIAFDSDNNVYVVWMDDNAGITANRDNINTRKRLSGGAWDGNVLDTNNTLDNTYPNAVKTLLAGAPYDYLQYVYTTGLAADFNINFAHRQAVPVGVGVPSANNPVDVNLEKIENNYAVFPPFGYQRDGNLTIDFNVIDLDYNGSFYGSGRLDANIDFRDTNGKSTRIITDLNLMVVGICDDLNFTNSTNCSQDWNIMLITDRNVFIDINVTDNNGSTDTNAIGRSIMIDNNAPTTFTTAGKASLRKQAREVINGDFNEHTKGTIDYNVLIQDLTSGLAPYDLNLYHKVAIDGNAESRWKYNMISITGTAGWQPEWHIADFNEITNFGNGDYNVNFSLDADHDYRAGVLPIDIPTWNSYAPSSFAYGDVSKQKFWLIGMEGIDVDKNMEYHLGVNLRETDGSATGEIHFWMCDWNYFDTNGDFRNNSSCRFISSIPETSPAPSPDFNEFEGLLKINDQNAFNGLVMKGRMLFGLECFQCANTNAGWSVRYNPTNNSRNIWSSINKGNSYSNVDAVPDFHLHWFNILRNARLVLRVQAEDKAGNDRNSTDNNYIYTGINEAPNIEIKNPIDATYSGIMDINGVCNDPDGDPLLIDVNLMDLNFGLNRILADRNVSCNSGEFALTFNTLAVPDGNYWIDVNAYDGFVYSGDRGDFNFAISNPPANDLPDINIIKVDNNSTSQPLPTFNHYIDGNFTIDLNVQDSDVNGVNRLDVNIDFRKIDTNVSARIITDLNLMQTGVCDDTNFTNTTRCVWDWNAIDVADGNYTIDVNITDLNSTTIKYGDFNFRIRNRNIKLSTSPGEIIEDVFIASGVETRTLFITQDGNTITESLDVYLTSGCPGGVLAIDKNSIASLNAGQSDFLTFTILPSGSMGVFKCAVIIGNQYGSISVNIEIFDEATTSRGEVGGSQGGGETKKPPGIFIPEGAVIQVIYPTSAISLEVLQGWTTTQKIVLKNISNKPINKIDFLASRGIDDLLTIESDDGGWAIDVNAIKTFYLKFSPASERKIQDLNGFLLIVPDENKAIAMQIFTKIKILRADWQNMIWNWAGMPLFGIIDLRSIITFVGAILLLGIIDSRKRNVYSFVGSVVTISVVSFFWLPIIHPLLFFLGWGVIMILIGWSYWWK